MIYKNGVDLKIEESKKILGLTGDVYVYDGEVRRRIASLESHKQLFPESRATTIEEAYEERVICEKKRAKALAAAEQEDKEIEMPVEETFEEIESGGE